MQKRTDYRIDIHKFHTERAILIKRQTDLWNRKSGAARAESSSLALSCVPLVASGIAERCEREGKSVAYRKDITFEAKK